MTKFEVVCKVNIKWLSVSRVVFEYLHFKVLVELWLQLRFHHFDKRLFQEWY